MPGCLHSLHRQPEARPHLTEPKNGPFVAGVSPQCHPSRLPGQPVCVLSAWGPGPRKEVRQRACLRVSQGFCRTLHHASCRASSRRFRAQRGIKWDGSEVLGGGCQVTGRSGPGHIATTSPHARGGGPGCRRALAPSICLGSPQRLQGAGLCRSVSCPVSGTVAADNAAVFTVEGKHVRFQRVG